MDAQREEDRPPRRDDFRSGTMAAPGWPRLTRDDWRRLAEIDDEIEQPVESA